MQDIQSGHLKHRIRYLYVLVLVGVRVITRVTLVLLPWGWGAHRQYSRCLGCFVNEYSNVWLESLTPAETRHYRLEALICPAPPVEPGLLALAEGGWSLSQIIAWYSVLPLGCGVIKDVKSLLVKSGRAPPALICHVTDGEFLDPGKNCFKSSWRQQCRFLFVYI